MMMMVLVIIASGNKLLFSVENKLHKFVIKVTYFKQDIPCRGMGLEENERREWGGRHFDSMAKEKSKGAVKRSSEERGRKKKSGSRTPPRKSMPGFLSCCSKKKPPAKSAKKSSKSKSKSVRKRSTPKSRPGERSKSRRHHRSKKRSSSARKEASSSSCGTSSTAPLSANQSSDKFPKHEVPPGAPGAVAAPPPQPLPRIPTEHGQLPPKPAEGLQPPTAHGVVPVENKMAVKVDEKAKINNELDQIGTARDDEDQQQTSKAKSHGIRDGDYPQKKFTIIEYVHEGRRVRRWEYEDITPLTVLPHTMGDIVRASRKAIDKCHEGTKTKKQAETALTHDLDQLGKVMAKE
ncbi:unnamed protein product [Caenorhabditis auriculariae]|uniref:Uncharacterized protein n=1 Tax=Caenorhabditis auriculariae TaxID=2777116 RepID=A0A8S1HH34_9PELO|nr:unnamed protein product [Caenorhabditis auriculariae]